MLYKTLPDGKPAIVGATFPKVRGRNLTYESKIMPRDFEGELNLVVLAFRMRHQRLVNTWLPFATSWIAQNAAVRFYEVPVIQYMMPIYHDFIDRGMADGIRDLETRQRTYTLYTNVAKFTRNLGIESTNDIITMLVDGSGHILAATSGPYTQEKGDIMWQAARAKEDVPTAAD